MSTFVVTASINGEFVLKNVSNIVCKVKVNRNRSPQNAIYATGRSQYVDHRIVDSMPKHEGNEVDVVFFKPDLSEYTHPGFMRDDDFEKALNRRCLEDDPIAVAAANEAYPDFADEHPNAAHWKDENGNWFYASFVHINNVREVYVGRHGGFWNVGWWLSGVKRK